MCPLPGYKAYVYEIDYHAMYQEPLLTQTQTSPWKSGVVAGTVSWPNLHDDNVDSTLPIPKAPARHHRESMKSN